MARFGMGLTDDDQNWLFIGAGLFLLFMGLAHNWLGPTPTTNTTAPDDPYTAPSPYTAGNDITSPAYNPTGGTLTCGCGCSGNSSTITNASNQQLVNSFTNSLNGILNEDFALTIAQLPQNIQEAYANPSAYTAAVQSQMELS